MEKLPNLENNYAEYLNIIKSVIREAGAYVRTSQERGSQDKSNQKDFVTVADIKSQDILRAKLSESFRGAVILSEEDDEAVRQQLYEPAFTGFVLDPIDGTYNFKRDMRESAVSVGYIENGEIQCGAVYDPYKDELFTAMKGNGAFRDDAPIHVSGQQQLAGASVCTSNSYDDKAMERNLRRHLAIYEQTSTMPWTSCPGSGVLIMAWVACGRLDAYHHNGLKPWDNAAAFLIAREAGAVVWTLEGEEAGFTSATALMGTPEIAQQLQAIFHNANPELLR